MEGLAAASSVIAVVSIAVQLADSIQKLCDFWESVQDAPEEIRGVIDDLKVLQLVVDELRHNEEMFGPRAIVTQSIQGCQRKMNTLLLLVNELVPNFASSKRVIQKWTALKGAMRNGKIQKFRVSLEEAKSTLMLASQSASIRSQNGHFDSHQHTILTLSQKVETLHMQSATQITTSFPSVAELSASPVSSTQLEDEIIRAASSISNPVMRYAYITAATSAMKQVVEQTNNLNERRSRPSKSRKTSSTTRSYWHWEIMDTLFGTVRIHRRCEGVVFDKGTQTREVDEDYNKETHIILHPAAWLIKCGLVYALKYRAQTSSDFFTSNISVQRVVPDDALQFELCKEGNMAAVRDLISAGKASVNDVNSCGRTLLHIAAEYCPVCPCGMVEMLIRAGSDVGAVDYWGNDPFRLACDRYDIVEAFIHAASNVGAFDYLGNDPFRLACCCSRSAILSGNLFGVAKPPTQRIDVLRLLSSYPRVLDAMETKDFAHRLRGLLSEDLVAERNNLCHGMYSATWFVCSFKPEVEESLKLVCQSLRIIPYVQAALIGNGEILKQLLEMNQEVKVSFSDVFQRWDCDVSIEPTKGEIMLAQAVVDLHKTDFRNVATTMEALKFPNHFWRWRRILLDCEINLEKFVEDDIAKCSEWATVGWTKDSLLELFRADMVETPVASGSKGCQRCYFNSGGSEQPSLWWHEYVESIMVRGMTSHTHGATVLGTTMLSLSEADVEPMDTFYRRRLIYPKRFRREKDSIARTGYCTTCLKEMERDAVQDLEEKWNSPFLLSL